jgi:hypothetical protein
MRSSSWIESLRSAPLTTDPVGPAVASTLRGDRARRLGHDDREREALARTRYETVDQLRRALRASSDHDPVGLEGRQRIRNCLKRICVADATLDVNCGSSQLPDKCGQPFLCPTASGVFVRQPVPEPGVQRRRDDEDLGVRQPGGNDDVDGDEEDVGRARFSPEARNLVQGGEWCRTIDAPALARVAESADDSVGDRVVGL